MKKNSQKDITPMSTMFVEGLMNFFFMVLFITVCNPISMFILNIFCPDSTARLAHDRVFFDERCSRFYTKLALKWPFYWAKWWLKPHQLMKYSVDQQLKYFMEVNDSPETINFLSTATKNKLVQTYPLRLKKIIEKGLIPDDLFRELLNNNRIDLLETYLKRNNTQISDEIFEEILKENQKGLLRIYLSKGTISKAQQALLAKYAIKDNVLYLSSPIIQAFYEYIERCGLRQDVLDNIRSGRSGIGFKINVNNCQISYEQKCAVRHLRGVYNSDWDNFLKNRTLSAAAEEEMSINQYTRFHQLGYKLHDETILAWLQKPNKEFHKAIFQYEPEHGLITDEIKKLVETTPNLKALYDEVVKD